MPPPPAWGCRPEPRRLPAKPNCRPRPRGVAPATLAQPPQIPLPPPPAWGCHARHGGYGGPGVAAPARVGLPACPGTPRSPCRLPPPPAWGCHPGTAPANPPPLAAPARVGLPSPYWSKDAAASCRPRPRGVAIAAIHRRNRGGLPPPPAWGCLAPRTYRRSRLVAAPARVGLPSTARAGLYAVPCRPRPRGVAAL